MKVRIQGCQVEEHVQRFNKSEDAWDTKQVKQEEKIGF